MKLNVRIRWQLVFYDIVLLCAIDSFLLALYYRNTDTTGYIIVAQLLLSLVCVIGGRMIASIYGQIWRYGGIQCYIRLLIADFCAFLVYILLELALPIPPIATSYLLSMSCVDLLAALAMRMMYRYAYKCAETHTLRGRFLRMLLVVFAGKKIAGGIREETRRTKIAIIGAGHVGVALAEELLVNPSAVCVPICFVDINIAKIHREIHGIPVLPEDEKIFIALRDRDIQTVVFALPEIDVAKKRALFDRYLGAGFKIKSYDFPLIPTADKKRQVRDFDIEEILFRNEISMRNEKTDAYYRDKVILITGGGGSIGSELCRQLAKMQPKKIVILDIYENGAYDVQQELRIAYGTTLELQVEIASINNRPAMERVFAAHVPQIVINAAAHKHVPLMEHNCIEAVENNVFGCVILVELCEQFGVERFMMVSTDKAVNPTNVMGATKRMCEMIVQSASEWGNAVYSATRFGNVLGSAGSVIPLFKRQIANGGPITLTDKRIIRYFMTIPEASQLVLQSGALAHNGELFVLDMGQPVKILDLAQNMIKLSGVNDIDIIETGLRPGEKLYEELLIKTEELDKTENRLIYIERDKPLSREEVEEKLRLLRVACASGSDEYVREVLMQVIPTYRRPEEVNATAENAEEMRLTQVLNS